MPTPRALLAVLVLALPPAARADSDDPCRAELHGALPHEAPADWFDHGVAHLHEGAFLQRAAVGPRRRRAWTAWTDELACVDLGTDGIAEQIPLLFAPRPILAFGLHPGDLLLHVNGAPSLAPRRWLEAPVEQVDEAWTHVRRAGRDLCIRLRAEVVPLAACPYAPRDVDLPTSAVTAFPGPDPCRFRAHPPLPRVLPASVLEGSVLRVGDGVALRAAGAPLDVVKGWTEGTRTATCSAGSGGLLVTRIPDWIAPESVAHLGLEPGDRLLSSNGSPMLTDEPRPHEHPAPPGEVWLHVEREGRHRCVRTAEVITLHTSPRETPP